MCAIVQELLPFHDSFLDQETQRYQDAKAPNKQQMHLTKGICKKSSAIM
jgi:hypothetical protein